MKHSQENRQKAFEEDGYDGWEIDVTNIKFLLYSADDPYRSLYLNYADEINIAKRS